MATLREIRDGLKTIIEGGIPGITVYPRVPGSSTGRCVIVEPSPSDYLQVMTQATWSWSMRLSILVPAATLDIGQQDLDELIDMDGDRSIPRLLLANMSLGLPRTQVVGLGMTDYGGQHESGGVNHLGAAINLDVHTGR